MVKCHFQGCQMDLQKYIDSFPRNERTAIREAIAKAHSVTEVAVRSWANGTRKHPCTRAAMEITEKITTGKVSRHELRPDVFGKK